MFRLAKRLRFAVVFAFASTSTSVFCRLHNLNKKFTLDLLPHTQTRRRCRCLCRCRCLPIFILTDFFAAVVVAIVVGFVHGAQRVVVAYVVDRSRVLVTLPSHTQASDKKRSLAWLKGARRTPLRYAPLRAG